MRFDEIFDRAIWIGAADKSMFPLFRKSFTVCGTVRSASIRIIGYGASLFYLNGKLGTQDLYAPVVSDFEERAMLLRERFGHRAYYNEYDITSLLHEGKNTLAVMLGNNWYNGNYSDVAYGNKKLVYRIQIVTDAGTDDIVSDESDRVAPSYLSFSYLPGREWHDYRKYDDGMLLPEYDDSAWDYAVAERPVQTEFYRSTCPPDRVIQTITPTFVGYDGDAKIYDAGENLAGFPVILSEQGSDVVTVTFSEEMEDGRLVDFHGYNQEFVVLTGGRALQAHAGFTWYGFRYFRVEGRASAVSVCRVHADVKVTSSFECADETLNWIYKTYLNTQTVNLHTGIPSDCPQIERRGYTGDGQLTCRAAMRTLDMRAFYDKWIDDISDCQDRNSGHVQYTAPVTKSGGGPGGWGAAIVIVPYEFWKYYGDDSKIRSMYPQMLRYFDYLEAHSECGLVVSDEPGRWCLGEWCTPGPVLLPAPFINNYFYVVALKKTIEIAKYLGHHEDVPALEKKIHERKRAIECAYFNPWDGNLIGNRQGANAFALDIGLGDKRTRENFIRYYEQLGHYDTGIFGTDLVTRLLFELGRGDIAVRLMTASEPWGFGKWQKDGATTFWEEWGPTRSHNHPMFGAVVSCFFEYLLGIRAKNEGQTKLTIAPVAIDGLPYAKGHVSVPAGEVFVSCETVDGKMCVEVRLPEGVEAEVRLPDGYTETLCGPVNAVVQSKDKK